MVVSSTLFTPDCSKKVATASFSEKGGFMQLKFF